MICPNCQSKNYDDAQVCAYCGAELTSQYMRPNVNAQGMIFHYIYAIWNIWCGTNAVISLISVFFSTIFDGVYGIEFAIPMFTCLAIALTQGYSLLCGITLLMKKKIAYVLTMIQIWVGLIGGILMTLFGILSTYMGSVGTGEWDGLWYVLAFIIFIASVPSVIWNICSMIYYKKRKAQFIK